MYDREKEKKLVDWHVQELRALKRYFTQTILKEGM